MNCFKGVPGSIPKSDLLRVTVAVIVLNQLWQKMAYTPQDILNNVDMEVFITAWVPRVAV